MKKKIIILIVLLFSLTGCTKYISDDNKKRVVNEKTGQSLPSNILCKPVDDEILTIYKKNELKLEVSLDKLPACENISVYNNEKYDNLWVQFFVMPLAWLIVKLGYLFSNYGLSVMVVGLFIRILLTPFNIKTMKQSERMQKLRPEMTKLEKKYSGKSDQESMMKKQQELMMLYKKHNVSPLGSCLISFVQLPLFFAFLEAIQRIPAIFEGSLGAFQLGTTPFIGLGNGNFYYIILILLIILTTYISFKYSMASANAMPEQQKQMKYMLGFMVVFIAIASFTLPTAIALYWIVTNGYIIVQNYIFRKRRK